MLNAVGFVTVAEPAGVTVPVGVTVTTYDRALFD
jgi:hypothetical protein